MNEDQVGLYRLTTESQLAILRDDDGGDGNTLTGYAAVFDTFTEIDSMMEGHFRERLDPKSFNRTLKDQPIESIRVQFDHGMDVAVGNLPIATPTRVEPDDFGLDTESRFTEADGAQNVKKTIEAGALAGMSIRFQVQTDRWEFPPTGKGKDRRVFQGDDLAERTIKEVWLREYGPVTWPAYEATTVGVRTADQYGEWRFNNPDRLVRDRTDLLPYCSDQRQLIPPATSHTALDRQLINRRHREIVVALKGM